MGVGGALQVPRTYQARAEPLPTASAPAVQVVEGSAQAQPRFQPCPQAGSTLPPSSTPKA